jgi:translation initiation factor IF-2
VKEGKIHTGTKVRIWRGEDPIGEGEIEQIQAGKSPVKEVGGGQECGMSYKGKVKLQAGDRIEAYVEERKTRKVEITR